MTHLLVSKFWNGAATYKIPVINIGMTTGEKSINVVDAKYDRFDILKA